MAYKTGNPTLGEDTFEKAKEQAVAGPPMTLEGTVQKSAMLLLITVGSAAFSWHTFAAAAAANQGGVLGLAGGAALVGFVLALIICFKQKTAPYLSWFYAAFEGIFLGAVSAAYEAKFAGIVFNAVGLTFGTFAAMLAAYQSKLIKPTENFKLGVVAATGGIAIVYIISMISGFFFKFPLPFIHDSGIIGIGFSIFVVIIAALNLVLDFDFIERGVELKAPRYMEWYAAFGLLVTLVWLYLEILRLLAKSRNR